MELWNSGTIGGRGRGVNHHGEYNLDMSKNKKRVAFRKNRAKPPRENDITRQEFLAIVTEEQ